MGCMMMMCNTKNDRLEREGGAHSHTIIRETKSTRSEASNIYICYFEQNANPKKNTYLTTTEHSQ